MTSVPNPENGAAYATVPPCTARTGSASAAAISIPFRTSAAPKRPAPRPNGETTRPDTGHGKLPRKGAIGSPARRAGETADVRLQGGLRFLQLAGIRGGQIALAIELIDAAVGGRDCLIERRARAAGFSGCGRDRFLPRAHLSHGFLLGVDGSPMRIEARPIELRDRRDAARHAAQRTEIFRAQQKREIPAAPALVDLHESLSHARAFGDPQRLDCRKPRRCGLVSRIDLGERGFRLLHILRFQLALQLESAELVQQRSGLLGESIGFGLELANALIRLRDERADRRALRLICGKG